MKISDCCGVALIVDKSSDLPHVYDDDYDLQVNLLICSKCGTIIGLDSKVSMGETTD